MAKRKKYEVDGMRQTKAKIIEAAEAFSPAFKKSKIPSIKTVEHAIRILRANGIEVKIQ